MILAIGLSCIAFIMLRYIPSILNFIDLLSWKGVEFCWRLFLHLLRWSCGFCFCFCWYAVLCLMTCICRTIPVSLEWNWLDHGVWSFWYAVELSLPIFYQGFWHVSSLKRLVCTFLFLLCPCSVWGKSNTGFIRMNLAVFLPLVFHGKVEKCWYYFFKVLIEFSSESFRSWPFFFWETLY
jgi:hypothetical protein